MRNTVAAAALAMLASSGSAYAADCTKGLLWPYVRNPGDCLTEQEVKTGVYMGAPQNGVAAGNGGAPVQPVAPVTMQDCHESGIWPFRSEECTTVTTTGATNSTAAAPKPAAATPVAKSAPAPAIVTQTSVAAPAASSCSKGLFWPFLRESGDCSTAIEKTDNKTNPAPVQASAPGAPVPVAMPAVVTQASPVPAQPVAPIQAAPTTTSCSKGLFWPFVRENGDCSTEIEKTSGKTNPAPVQATASAEAAPAAMPAVVRQTTPVPAPAAAPTQAAPATGSCSKGLFWPFVRERGDCTTAVEKASGASDPVPVKASAPAETAPAAMPAVVRENSPAPASAAVPAQTPPTTASCGKGLFWPFVRDSGDCATAAEKANDVMPPPVVVPASAQAAPPATASQPTAAPAESGGCHKGVLWPFVREPGDCPTNAGQGH